MIHVLDLFSGIGGFSLGLESTGRFRTVGFCEIEPFCREVLAHHWPGVPIHDDVRTLRWPIPVDLICGGFPCQDVSVAGKGAGLDGARSGLWSEFARLVGECRPRWVLAENVGALRTRGIDRVCSDLEAEGYAVWPLVVGAWAVGAPHRRDRVWVVAHCARDGQRGESETERSHGERARASGDEGLAHGDTALWEQPRRGGGAGGSGEALPGGPREAVGEPTGGRLAEPRRSDSRTLASASPLRWPARPGEPQHEWEEPRLVRFKRAPDGSPLSMGGSAYGLPLRLARRWNREALKALGNSVVPQVVAVLGQAIAKADEELR